MHIIYVQYAHTPHAYFTLTCILVCTKIVGLILDNSEAIYSYKKKTTLQSHKVNNKRIPNRPIIHYLSLSECESN